MHHLAFTLGDIHLRMGYGWQTKEIIPPKHALIYQFIGVAYKSIDEG